MPQPKPILDEEIDEDDDLDTSTDLDEDESINFDNSFDDFGMMDYGGQSNMSKHADLLKELTNFDPAIQRRIRNWLGLEWDEEVKQYKQDPDKAIINEKGAKWAIGFLSTYQAKTNFITNIDKQESKNIQLDLIQICWLVFPTIDDFEVKCTADWYRLCTELQTSAGLVMSGAGDGKYTKFFGESVHRTESVNMSSPAYPYQMNPQMKPATEKGFLSGIKNKILGRT
jgi:hypothetical protein